mmetsp:Transcript_6185/g.8031  ORF Transcript_6185/g.8031 Transcript_6185/m.8031 type:complete len:205 (-) Transcript_6185:1188-1802(-)
MMVNSKIPQEIPNSISLTISRILDRVVDSRVSPSEMINSPTSIMAPTRFSNSATLPKPIQTPTKRKPDNFDSFLANSTSASTTKMGGDELSSLFLPVLAAAAIMACFVSPYLFVGSTVKNSSRCSNRSKIAPSFILSTSVGVTNCPSPCFNSFCTSSDRPVACGPEIKKTAVAVSAPDKAPDKATSSLCKANFIARPALPGKIA